MRYVEKAHIYRYNRCIMEKLLSQLLPSFAHKALAADGITPVETVDIMNIPITNLAFDSRDVKDGSLFLHCPERIGTETILYPKRLKRARTQSSIREIFRTKFGGSVQTSSRAVRSKAPSVKRNDIFRPFCA